MLSVVHRCSVGCKCYADVHIWARHIRKQGGDLSQLRDILKRKKECHEGKRSDSRVKYQELTMPWTEVIKNVNYFFPSKN